MPTMHIHTPPLFQVELEKTTENRWTYFGVKVPRTLDYPSSSHKLKSALEYTVQSQCTPVPDRQTDGQTERRTNIVAIARRFVLTNTSRANNESSDNKGIHVTDTVA